MVGAANPGGSRTGDRYVAPHSSKFIGPLSPLRGPVANHVVIAHQPAYVTHRVVQPWIGPYPKLRAPLHETLVFPIREPAYVVNPLVQPWIGPYKLLRGPVHNTFAVPIKEPAYVVHRLVQPWIGPYPKLRGPLHETVVTAKQPTLARPRPHQGKPIVTPFTGPPVGRVVVVLAKEPAYVTHRLVQPWIGPYRPLRGPLHETLVTAHQPIVVAPYPHQGKPVVAQPPTAPVSRNLLKTAVQPAYNTHKTLRPWIGPYPPLRGPLTNRIVRTQNNPTAPRPHIQPAKIAAAVAPIGKQCIHIAPQPIVVRPHATYRPFRGYLPAQKPVSRNLLVRVRLTPPHTQPLLGPPPIIGAAVIVIVPTIPTFGACAVGAIASLAGACTPGAISVAGTSVPPSASGFGASTPAVAPQAGSTTTSDPPQLGACP